MPSQPTDSTIGRQKTGSLGPRQGGTGLKSFGKGTVLYAIEPNIWRALSPGSDTQVLTLATGLPSWAAVPSGVPLPHDITGAEHTAAGLTTGNVIVATGATTFAWQQLGFTDLSGTASNAQVPVGAVTQHQAALAIAFTQLTGTIANAQVLEGAVTQHQAALSIAFSQITGVVDADLLDGIDSTGFALASHAHAAADVTSGTFVDARVAVSNVTQHQAALSIAETQIPDGSLLARVGSTETITGSWTATHELKFSSPAVADEVDGILLTSAGSGNNSPRLIFRNTNIAKGWAIIASTTGLRFFGDTSQMGVTTGTERLRLTTTAIFPATDAGLDLGVSTNNFGNAWFKGSMRIELAQFFNALELKTPTASQRSPNIKLTAKDGAAADLPRYLRANTSSEIEILNGAGSTVTTLTNAGGAVFVDDVTVRGGQVSVFNHATDNDGLRIDALSDVANGGSARVFFKESASAETSGFSLIYAGATNPTLGGTAFTIAQNTFQIRRHDSSAAGVAVVTMNRADSNVTFAGLVKIASEINLDANGTESDPGYTWSGDGGSGMFLVSSGVLALTAGSTERMRLSSAGVSIANALAVTGALTTSSGRIISRRVATGDITLDGTYHYVTAAIPAGTRTLTLPAAPTNGREYFIRATTTVAGSLVIDRNGKLINLAATNVTISAEGEGRHLVYDTTEGTWWSTTI